MVYWKDEDFIVQFFNYISWDLIAQKVTFIEGKWEHIVSYIGKSQVAFVFAVLICYLCLYFLYLLGIGLSPLYEGIKTDLPILPIWCRTLAISGIPS